MVTAAMAKVEKTARSEIALRVNGADHHLSVDPRATLLDVLRDSLGLTGTKKGCDQGQCGACTVLQDGTRINACLRLAVMCDGADILTVEGLAQDGGLHPLQAAFLKHDALQCGYCTPGQVCSAIGLLAEIRNGMPSHVTADLNAAPPLSRAEIRERLSGNLCRCGAYANILAAIAETEGLQE